MLEIFPRGLGITRSTKLHPEDDQWGKNTFHIETSSDYTKQEDFKAISHESLHRDGLPNEGTDRVWRHRSCGPIPQLPIENVSDTKIRWLPENDFQPEIVKPLPRPSAFQTHKPLQSARVSATRRLANETRPIASLLPSPDCTKTSEILASGIPRGITSDDKSALWPFICSQNVRIPHKLGSRTTAAKRYSDNRLPRRLPPCEPIQGGSMSTIASSSRYLTIPGMECKSPEVSALPNSTNRILGNRVGHAQQLQIPVRTEARGITPLASSNTDLSKMVIKAGGKSPGKTELCQLYGKKRATPLQTIADSEQVTKEPSTEKSNTNDPRLLTRNRVVDRECERIKSHSQRNLQTFLDNRRSLGSNLGRLNVVGTVDQSTKEVALQPKRDVRSVCNPSTHSTESHWLRSSDTIRQQDSSLLHPQGRGYQIQNTPKSYQRSVDPGRPVENLTNSAVSPGKIQRRRRSLVTGKIPPRMASLTSSNEGHFRSLRTTRNRPVRICHSTREFNLRVKRFHRLMRNLSKRLQSALDLQPGLVISPTKPYTEDPKAPEQCDRNLPTCSAEVAEGLLATRLNTPITRTPNANIEPGISAYRHSNRPTTSQNSGPGNGSMENWGWDSILNSWNEEEKKLLLSGWRASTLSTYKPAWERWCRWALTNNTHPNKPSPNQLARYLAQLFINEKLSYSTILVHKSAIVTFCNPTTEEKLSSDFLVKHTLKAIAMAKINPPKSPVWNPVVVKDWLVKNAPRLDSLYEVSCRTAILLLLSSGRRVHDLTLLNIAEGNILDEGTSIVLHPSFGSKTDTLKHQQSSWRLLEPKERNINPVFWIRKLIELSSDRRSGQNLYNLFISTRGQVKAATRTIIGGWVKNTLKLAGVEATPGSTRSAVASLNWLENYPIDNILERGNWKNENTFRKYYQKELLKHTAPEDPSLASLFQPVNIK